MHIGRAAFFEKQINFHVSQNRDGENVTQSLLPKIAN